MARYFVSMYTDGPATRWNVIDRQTQEWVRRFSTEQEALDYISRAPSVSRLCQKCGTETKGEEALVNGECWCHPCADDVGPSPSVSRPNGGTL